MMPHVIRLRGPWQYEPLARTRRLADGSSQIVPGPLPHPGEITLPSDWGGSLGLDFRGRVRFLRRFNRPTGLESVDRVELVIPCVDAFGSVALNQRPLATIPPGLNEFRLDIRSRLELHNLLVVEVELPECDASSAPLPRGDRTGCAGGMPGDVRLEIFAK
jgi:hypothetical protein